jgi:TonB-linked SusC/RagA family outer membrane protein
MSCPFTSLKLSATKCLFVMLLLFYNISWASKITQEDLVINLEKGSYKLGNLLRKIEKQTGFSFIYGTNYVNAKEEVSINGYSKAKLQDVLKDLLTPRKLKWTFVGKDISLSPATSTITPNLSFPTTDTTISVSGRILNNKGEPIVGATVRVKNSKMGTSTGSDGSFSISGVRPGASLVISSVSFVTQELAVDGKNTVGIIRLSDYIGALDETVVVAYESTTRRLNTGNVVSINSADIEKQPVNNPLYALQGRVAGLQVSPTTGLTGGAVNLQIRGNNSLSFQTEPLIVIDGLPIVNNVTALGHLDLLNISTLSFINPNEIESISVLKDADATSIYGSRGANGVILITTKKGKAGQAKVDINAQTGWGEVAKKMRLLNTKQYLQYRQESYANRGINISTQPLTTSNADLKYWDQNKENDWQRQLIGSISKYNDFQGNLSGGTSIIQYLIGGNYHKETTVFPGDNADQKASARISLTGMSQNKKLKTTVSASYMVDNNTLPSVDYTNSALTLPANAPNLYNSDGTLNWEPFTTGSSSWNNPLAELYRSYEAKISNLIASADINYKVLPSLNLKMQVGYNELLGNSFRKIYPFAGRPPEGLNDDASVAINSNEVKNLSVEPQINYNLNIGKASFTILVGGSMQSTYKKDEAINADGYKSDALLKNLAGATSYNLSNSSSEYKYAALFGRSNFNWFNKYLINLNARRDGSSRFGPGRQFGNFGSIGAAWILTQEDFIHSTLPFLSFGKLRFSLGTSGNDGIGDYAYLERYQPVEVNDLYQGARGYSSTGLFNNDYAWEITKKMEFGLETGFFKDRILFSASYFRNRSNNQLIQYPYASIAGPGEPYYNLPALIQNMGIEFTLNIEAIKSKDFTWTVSANLTRNRNKLLSYPDAENTPYYKALIGQSFYGDITAYKAAGVDQQTGKYQFETIDGKITSTPEDFNRLDNGRYIHINTLPKFYGGISNTFSYKGFNLNIFIQFNKQIGVNPYSSFVLRSGRVAVNVPQELLNSWKQPGDKSEFQQNGYTPLGSYLASIPRFLGSDWGYVDASFIRIKNASLSYDIPSMLIRKLKIQNMRLFAHGQNLLTFTKYKGLDPETRSTSSLPPLRVITLGINLTL